MDITFLLNGETVAVPEASPTVTLLDWLREVRQLKGTKEGCNEGDCGTGTVMVSDHGGARALNACILLLPQLPAKAVRTIEGIAGPDGTLHPVQQAMIDFHGSQCGFCTPGFIVSMAAAHLNGDRDHDTALAGKLCRCTGYAPIIRAGPRRRRICRCRTGSGMIWRWCVKLRRGTEPAPLLAGIERRAGQGLRRQARGHPGGRRNRRGAVADQIADCAGGGVASAPG